VNDCLKHCSNSRKSQNHKITKSQNHKITKSRYFPEKDTIYRPLITIPRTTNGCYVILVREYVVSCQLVFHARARRFACLLEPFCNVQCTVLILNFTSALISTLKHSLWRESLNHSLSDYHTDSQLLGVRSLVGGRLRFEKIHWRVSESVQAGG